MVEEREEESSVEVSQNREVQQSGGDGGTGCPWGPGPALWLASWHKQSSKKSKK